MWFKAIARMRRMGCGSLEEAISGRGKDRTVLTNFGSLFYQIGSDILMVGQSVIQLVSDLFGAGGGYGGGGVYPPGQYPLA